ncbi:MULTISPECIES: gallate dioxygenase [unclassified Pseudomonas]|uniref:gallate dioxygenase n=1 Tax=unclassified Pseudomonas TaxID=196821 RepID=UPI0021C91A11|nr:MULTISPECIES: gallate dioxygenase [unclassified Pseudomonas]MCU1731949.1 gallate dioxygenase [Pseudomonas sp. 20P_3.2_Bac4]MCU1744961.1 gallate dioxygenase [Pseudomonas sp. 20P_3.2_Bac5]
MARIIGGLAVSHTPTIGFAVDHDKQDEAAWAPIFESFKPVKAWLQARQPDVLFYIFNDHVTSFFFDHYSAFALGVDEQYGVADEGGNPRELPAIGGHAALSRHIGESLMADEFDMSFFRDKPLDHGFFSPMSALLPCDNGWPVQIVPLQVGVLQFPIPSAARCFKLGQALRRAIESFPQDLKVAIVATGGVSHQVHGERCGFNNPEWDAQFIDLFVNDPVQLTRLTQAEYATLGGMEGAEVITWLIMRGALSATVEQLHYDYYLPSMTGIATLLLENRDRPVPAEVNARHLAHMGHQLAGAEKLEGTYPFTLERSARSYRLNKFLHRMIEPAWRARFLAEPEAMYAEAALSEEERDLLRRRDWRGLIQYGAIFFVLEKLGAVLGISNLDIYAAMRGQSLEDFMKTRNQQVLYSVAGKAD